MDFKPPPSMRFDFAANLAETWRKWEQQFRIYFTAAELDKKKQGHTGSHSAAQVWTGRC